MFNITNIESMSVEQAAGMAIEIVPVKTSYLIYLVDFRGAFGYSALVYDREGHYIHYANDYELHHNGKSREDLRRMYIDRANGILFELEEMSKPVKNYEEYKRKEYFVRNYLPMRFDHMSQFRIIHNDEEDRAYEMEKAEHPYYSNVCFSYFKREEDRDTINAAFDALSGAMEKMEDDFSYWKAAFYDEMANHEYHINYYQGDYDVLSAFGPLTWAGEGSGPRTYFDQLGFSDSKRRAYYAAREEFLSNAAKNDWY